MKGVVGRPDHRSLRGANPCGFTHFPFNRGIATSAEGLLAMTHFPYLPGGVKKGKKTRPRYSRDGAARAVIHLARKLSAAVRNFSNSSSLH